MQAILSDVNMEGQVRRLVQFLEGPEWREFWEALGLSLLTFADLGLSEKSPDSLIWRTCQERGVILITANRNNEGPDSLEATIRAENSPDSLPVFTVANQEELLTSRDYLERVAARLMEYLIDIDQVRGTGRLYLP